MESKGDQDLKEIRVPTREFIKYQKYLNQNQLSVTDPQAVDMQNHATGIQRKRGSVPRSTDHELLGSAITVKKSKDFYNFPFYRSDCSSATHTILPSKLIPSASKSKKRTTARLPVIKTPSNMAAVSNMRKIPIPTIHHMQHSSQIRLPVLKRETKARFMDTNFGLHETGVSEQSLSKSDGSMRDKRTGKERRIGRDGGEDKHRIHTPKITAETDPDHFSAKNISETNPGTVRLTVYYHEPPKRRSPISLHLDSKEEDSLTSLKGLIYDKQNLFYHPPDPGPRGSLKSRWPSFSSIADVVMFKVTLDHRLGKAKAEIHNTSQARPSIHRHTVLPPVKKRNAKNKHSKY